MKFLYGLLGLGMGVAYIMHPPADNSLHPGYEHRFDPGPYLGEDPAKWPKWKRDWWQRELARREEWKKNEQQILDNDDKPPSWMKD